MSVLDRMEVALDANRPAEEIASELRPLLDQMPANDPARPRAHRLMGIALNRLRLPRDSLGELTEARRLAIKHQDQREQAAVARAISVVHSWRGAGLPAALELLHSLAIASACGDQSAIARGLAEAGRIEMEVGRNEHAAYLLRMVARLPDAPLPPRELHRSLVNLCQVLNRTARSDEVLTLAAEIRGMLPAEDARLHFLVHLEEARAMAQQGDFARAEEALRNAGSLIQDENSFEGQERDEVEAELRLARGDPSAGAVFRRFIDRFEEDELTVRAATARMRLADSLALAGQHDEAVECLRLALRSAVEAGYHDLADRVRSHIIKSRAGDDLLDLSGDLLVMGKGSALGRRFILRGRVGSGGFSTVFRAIDLNDGGLVAIKRNELHRAYDERQRTRLLSTVKTEYAAALTLTHPGVARVRDILVDPGDSLFVVQDFVDGPTLRAVLSGAPEPAFVLGLLADIAHSLGALHAKGVVHRDLKPENVIVRGGVSPVLIDLGIALVEGAQDRLAGMGTANYVAPEQKKGGGVDRRADIYAFGRMIVETWDACGPAASGTSWLKFPRRKPAMPRELRGLVKAMLRESPRDRPDDLESVAAALRSAAARLRP